MKVVSTERDEACAMMDDTHKLEFGRRFSGYVLFHRLCALGRKPEVCSYLADMLRFYKMVDRRERSDA
jgi:hypothetical protein